MILIWVQLEYTPVSYALFLHETLTLVNGVVSPIRLSGRHAGLNLRRN